MICPACNKEYIKIYKHYQVDEKHKIFLQEQIELLKILFYNLNFNSKQNLNDYGIYLNYDRCLNIWQDIFGKKECKNRANKLNGIGVSKAKIGIKFIEEHLKNLSKSHKNQKAWNKGLTVETSESVKQYVETKNRNKNIIIISNEIKDIKDIKNKIENKIENIDYVECKICGLHGKFISRHITKIHNISIEEYRKNYPEFETMIKPLKEMYKKI